MSEPRVGSREWFLHTRGWKPIALAVVLTLLIGGLFVAASRSGERNDSHDKIELVALEWPASAREWKREFKRGDYRRWKKKPGYYSRSFKREYLRKAKKAYYREHGCRTTSRCRPAPFSRSGTWEDFTDRDTCATRTGSGTFPDCSFDWKKQRMLLASDYWQDRAETQQRWTVRVLFCGGMGLAIFATGGTVAAAVGPGATGCLVGFGID